MDVQTSKRKKTETKLFKEGNLLPLNEGIFTPENGLICGRCQ